MPGTPVTQFDLALGYCLAKRRLEHLERIGAPDPIKAREQTLVDRRWAEFCRAMDAIDRNAAAGTEEDH
jgi:hypothetical protein